MKSPKGRLNVNRPGATTKVSAADLMLHDVAEKGKLITKPALPMTVAAKPNGRTTTRSRNAKSGSVSALAGDAGRRIRTVTQQADSSLIFTVSLHLLCGLQVPLVPRGGHELPD